MAIKFNEVSFFYEKVKKNEIVPAAISDINLTINDTDEFVTIVGHTGSGKSTLIQHINGLIFSTKGEVLVNGILLSKKNKNLKLKPIRQQVGFVFQFPEYQLFEETVLKDILYGPKNFGLNEEETLKRVKELAIQLNIKDILNKSPFNISGGQMRKVAIAGILAYNPDILLLDEPTRGLDPKGAKEIMDFFKKLQTEQHKSIVMITHDMDLVYEYSTRVIVMNEGKVVFDGSKEELFKQEYAKYHLEKPTILKTIDYINEKTNRNISYQNYNLDVLDSTNYLTVKGNSFLHKLDPRFKIISTFILMVAIFLIPSSLNNIYYLLGFLGLFLVILLICRINLLAVINGIKPIMFIGLFTFALQILYNQEGTLVLPVSFNISWLTILISIGLIVLWNFTKKYIPLKTTYTLVILALILWIMTSLNDPTGFWMPTINVYDSGLVKGAFFLLRIVLVVMLSTLLTISTSTIEINLGLEWVLGPLKLIKVPVAEIAMMFSLTLRFIPTLLIETNKIMKAQASRGIDFNEGNFVEKVKQIVTLLIPMFFISIVRAEDLANAMEARGYVIGEPRTNIDELRFQARDCISFVVVLLILAATIVLQVIS